MKKLYESRTIIFFVLTLIVAIAGVFGFADFTPSGQEAEIVAIVISIVGLVLRMFTSKGVEL